MVNILTVKQILKEKEEADQKLIKIRQMVEEINTNIMESDIKMQMCFSLQKFVLGRGFVGEIFAEICYRIGKLGTFEISIRPLFIKDPYISETLNFLNDPEQQEYFSNLIASKFPTVFGEKWINTDSISKTFNEIITKYNVLNKKIKLHKLEIQKQLENIGQKKELYTCEKFTIELSHNGTVCVIPSTSDTLNYIENVAHLENILRQIKGE